MQPILKERWTAELEEAWKVRSAVCVAFMWALIRDLRGGVNASCNGLDVRNQSAAAAAMVCVRHIVFLMRHVICQDVEQRDTSLTDACTSHWTMHG